MSCRVFLLFLVCVTLSCAPPARPRGFSPPAGGLAEKPGGFSFGKSFLRSREGILEARFTGTPYERGYVRGRLCYRQIVAGERDLDALLRQLIPSSFRRWEMSQLLSFSMRQSEKFISPEHRAEIAGIADAEFPDPLSGGWNPWQRHLALHSLHDFSQRFIDTIPLSGACSGFAANAQATRDGHVYLARNFDFEAGARFDREKIVAAIVPEHGFRYLSVTFGGLTGVVSGMNEKGLALSLQALTGGPTASAGEPATLLAADILQNDATVEEAVARLRGAPVLVSDIYLLADAQGTLAAVEKTPRVTGVRRGAGTISVTNSALTPEVFRIVGAPPRTSTSEIRLRRLNELVDGSRGKLDAASAVGILRDREGTGNSAPLGPGNRNAIDASIACHSVVFDLSLRRAYVAAAPHTLGRYVAFDLDLLSNAAPSDARFESLDADALPEDPFLTSGAYGRYLEARRANRQARARLTQGDAAETLRLTDRALELAPGFVEALACRGEARATLGRFPEAAADFDAALGAGPEDFREEILLFRDAARRGRLAGRTLKFPLSLEDILEENASR